MIEIQNLAVAIRDTAALDTDGIVAAQMARDLSDTNPRIMPSVFKMARLRFTWLPRTAQFLDLYDEARKLKANADEVKVRERTRHEEDRLAEDRRLHPEKYMTFGGIVLATPGCDEHVLSLQRHADQKKNLQAAEDNRPTVQQCPYCHRELPLRVADLRNLSIADLQAMIDAKQSYQQFVAKGRAAVDAQIAAASEVQPKTKRGKKVSA